VLVALPNAGDDLQAMKRGVLELVDVVAVNKADIDPGATELARTQIANALSMLPQRAGGWTPRVVKLSALQGDGVDAVWREAERCRETMSAAGALAAKRKGQALDWLAALLEHELKSRFYRHPAVKQELAAVRAAVAAGSLTPAAAAAKLLALAKS
jgi:LAO/AO transport system kinase